MPTPFFDAIRRHAAAAPERPSLTVGEMTLTRAELVAAVERVAAVFAERGVGEGSWVTIALPNGIEFVAVGAGGVAARGDAAADLAPPARPASAKRSSRWPTPRSSSATQAFEPAEAGGRPVLSAAEHRDDAGARIPRRQRPRRARGAAVLSPEWKVVTSGGSTGRPKLIVATQPGRRRARWPGSARSLRLRPDGASW